MLQHPPYHLQQRKVPLLPHPLKLSFHPSPLLVLPLNLPFPLIHTPLTVIHSHQGTLLLLQVLHKPHILIRRTILHPEASRGTPHTTLATHLTHLLQDMRHLNPLQPRLCQVRIYQVMRI